MYIHIYKGSPTAGGVDGQLVSEDISSTLVANAAAGATTLTVASTANFCVGLSVKLGSEVYTLSAVDFGTNVLTIPAPGLGSAHNSGETIRNIDANSSPVTTSMRLISNLNQESDAMKLAVRCESGYQTSGNTVIGLSGDMAARWALSTDGQTWGAYGSSLTIAATIISSNIIFYAKYKAVAGEQPMNDSSLKFTIAATIQPVA